MFLSSGVDRFSGRSFALAFANAACHSIFGAVFPVSCQFELGIFLGDGERSWLKVWEGQLFKLVFDKFWSIGQNV